MGESGRYLSSFPIKAIGLIVLFFLSQKEKKASNGILGVLVLVCGGIEGIAFALGMTGVEVKKTVLDPNNTGVGRIALSDQFTLSITNANGNQFDKRGSATTTGAELGEQKDAQGNVLQ